MARKRRGPSEDACTLRALRMAARAQRDGRPMTGRQFDRALDRCRTYRASYDTTNARGQRIRREVVFDAGMPEFTAAGRVLGMRHTRRG